MPEYGPSAESSDGRVVIEPWRGRVVELARMFIHYRQEAEGASMFGRWYGAQVPGTNLFTRGPWCGCFVTFIYFHAGVRLEVVQHAGYSGFAKAEIGRAWFRAKQYDVAEPKPGDLVFFQLDDDPAADHVGIVTSFEGGKLWTIEGNTRVPGRVAEQPRPVSTVLMYADPSKAFR